MTDFWSRHIRCYREGDRIVRHDIECKHRDEHELRPSEAQTDFPDTAQCVVCLTTGRGREPVCGGCLQIAGDILKTTEQHPTKATGVPEYTTGARLRDIIDENFGTQPVMSDDEALSFLERKLFDRRRNDAQEQCCYESPAGIHSENCPTRADEARCRRCSECRGENHHWLEECEEPTPEKPDGWAGYICKHCEARAAMCLTCDGAAEPGHVCDVEEDA